MIRGPLSEQPSQVRPDQLGSGLQPHSDLPSQSSQPRQVLLGKRITTPMPQGETGDLTPNSSSPQVQPQITHIGFKNASEGMRTHIQNREALWQAIYRERAIQELKAREAAISTEKRDTFNKASKIREEYFREKMKSIGLDTTQHIEIYFVNMDPNKPSAGANIRSLRIAYVVADRKVGDPFDWVEAAAHEESHAHTVMKNSKIWKIKTYGEQEYDKDVGTISSQGLDLKTVVRNRENLDETMKLGGALENGFATWDASDVYHRTKHLFPEETAVRNQYMSTHEYLKYLPTLQTHLDFLIQPDLIEANIRINESGIGKGIGVTYLHAILAKQISRTIGDALDHALPDNEKLIKGREFFDKARMINPKDGWKMVTQVFGAERAKCIFSADDQGNNIIEALLAVIQTQVEKGIFQF